MFHDVHVHEYHDVYGYEYHATSCTEVNISQYANLKLIF